MEGLKASGTDVSHVSKTCAFRRCPQPVCARPGALFLYLYLSLSLSRSLSLSVFLPPQQHQRGHRRLCRIKPELLCLALSRSQEGEREGDSDVERREGDPVLDEFSAQARGTSQTVATQPSTLTASKRRGNNRQGLNNFYLKSQGLHLSYVCHIRSRHRP